MGFKPRYTVTPPRPVTVNVTLARSDGYTSKASNLSNEAGLAIATIINRATYGLPVRVVWEENGEEDEVVVPGRSKD